MRMHRTALMAGCLLSLSAGAALASQNVTRVIDDGNGESRLTSVSDGSGITASGSGTKDLRGDNGIGWPDGSKATAISDGSGITGSGSSPNGHYSPRAALALTASEPLSIAAGSADDDPTVNDSARAVSQSG